MTGFKNKWISELSLKSMQESAALFRLKRKEEKRLL